jgi:GNAT superfamily N-acetyltransferase
MDDTFTIRLATLADIPTLVHQRHAMFTDARTFQPKDMVAHDATFAQWAEEYMARGEFVTWLMMDGDDEVVAGVGIWLINLLPSPGIPSTHRAYVMNVYTEPAFRRRGLARRLMETCRAWCEQHGVEALILHASDAGRPLYEAVGFAPTNEMRLRLNHT